MQRIYSAPLRLCGKILLTLVIVCRGFFLGFFGPALLLLRRRGFGSLLRSFSSLDFTRIVNQLDDCQLRTVAVAMAQLQDARVTTRSIFVTLAEVVEKSLQSSDPSRSFRSQLPTLAGELTHHHVARVKETRRLASQVQCTRVRAFTRKAARAPRQSDRALDKWSQLLGLRQSGNDALLA